MTIKKDLGPLELEILAIIKKNNGTAISVGDVQSELSRKSKKKLAYTTIMTVMSRLYVKDLLKRQKEGKQYLYQLTHKSEKMGLGLMEKIHHFLFGQHHLSPIIGMIDANEELSKEDLETLKDYLQEKIKKKSEN